MDEKDEKRDQPLITWIWAHSGLSEAGPQCPDHPPINQMTGAEQVDALLDDTGLTMTRQWINQTAGKLGVPRRGRTALRPRVSLEDKRKSNNERWRRWHDRLQQDPQALEAYRQRRSRPTAAAKAS